MKPLRTEPELYTSHRNGALIGVSGSYVDDMFYAGTAEFRTEFRVTHNNFEMGEDKSITCAFTGFFIDRDDAGDILQHQAEYLMEHETLPTDANYSSFRSMHLKLAWLAHSRADCMLEISQLKQITSNMFSASTSTCIRQLNYVVR